MSGLAETELRQQIGELLDIRDALSQKLRAAQHEAEALAAQVEALRDTCSYWINHAKPSGDCSKSEYNTWLALGYQSNAMTKNPQQHLRDVRAEAIESALDYMHSNTSSGNSASDDFDLIRDYAERVKAGKL